MKLGSSPLSAGVGLWFLPRRNGHALLGFAGDAVRVAKGKLAFVAGGGFDIQNASREAVGDRLRHAFALAIHAFAANAQQWQRGTPRRRTYLRKRTSTVALRLASPSMAHSKPGFSRVGCLQGNVRRGLRFCACAGSRWQAARSGMERRIMEGMVTERASCGVRPVANCHHFSPTPSTS